MYAQVPIAELEEALESEGAREILESFLEDTSEVLTSIEQAICDRQAEPLRSASHMLKGCYKAIGVQDAASLCAAMENDARNGQWQSAEERLPQLKKASDEIRAFIGNYLNGEQSARAM